MNKEKEHELYLTCCFALGKIEVKMAKLKLEKNNIEIKYLNDLVKLGEKHNE